MFGSKLQDRLVPLAVLSLLALLFPLRAGRAEERAVKNEVHALPVSAGGQVIIENERGNISIEQWDKPSGEVNVFKSSPHPEDFDRIKIQVDEQPNRWIIRATHPEKLGREARIDYVLFLPPQVELHVQTAEGHIQLKDFRGRAVLHTGRGDIKLTHVTGAIEARTEAGNGVLDLQSPVTQSITLKTEDGSIKARLDPSTDAFLWAEAEEGTVNSHLSAAETPTQAAALWQGRLGRGGKLIHLQTRRGGIELETAGEHAMRAEPLTAKNEEPEHPNRPLNKRLVETKSKAPAAPAVARAGSSLTTFSVQTNLITLNATVQNRATGTTISNLRKEQFLVYEDRVQQEVAYFSPVDTPFNLLLLLDISGSVRSQFHIIQEASIRFTQLMRPTDRIAVAVFNSRFKLLSDFTNDRSQLAQAILRAAPGGGTAFYDAMQQSIDSVFRDVRGRKAIVVFTDGVDNQHESYRRAQGSRITFPELFRRIEESDITIYPIFLDTEGYSRAGPATRGQTQGGIDQIIIDILQGRGRGRPGSGRRGPPPATGGRSEAALYAQAKDELNQMAEQTGGRLYAPKVASDLAGVYEQIVAELSVQYSLGYYPSKPVGDREWRRIRVTIQDQPEYVVRTRKGYYATARSEPRADAAGEQANRARGEK